MRHCRKDVIIKFRKCKSNASKVDPKHHTERQKRISAFAIVNNHYKGSDHTERQKRISAFAIVNNHYKGSV